MDHVVQLAHVARPVVADQAVQRGGGEDLLRAAEAREILLQEILRHRLDILRPLAQRAQGDGRYREAEQQVPPEDTLGGGGFEVHVGRGHDPGVDPPRHAGADPGDLALLQHPQQLRLHGQRQLAHLVQQQRAARRGSNQPICDFRAPVKAPFSWPNSSDSTRDSVSAPQFTARNGPPRPLRACSSRAATSLPVPVSP